MTQMTQTNPFGWRSRHVTCMYEIMFRMFYVYNVYHIRRSIIIIIIGTFKIHGIVEHELRLAIIHELRIQQFVKVCKFERYLIKK